MRRRKRALGALLLAVALLCATMPAMATDDGAVLRMMDTARAMARHGVNMVLYYTFPRHEDMAVFADEMRVLRAHCERNGIAFEQCPASDPIGAQGEIASRQAIVDDVIYRAYANPSRRIGVLTTCSVLYDALCEADGVWDQVIDLSMGGEEP